MQTPPDELRRGPTFRTIVAAVPQLVWVTDRDGRLVYANPAVAQFAGRSATAMIGRPWTDLIHPDDVPLIVEEHYRAGMPEWLGRLRRSDGAYRYHLGRTATLRESTAEPGGWVVVAHDVHERRRERLSHRFLSALTQGLAGAPDSRDVLNVVVQSCVPEWADQAAVYLESPGGIVQLGAIATTDERDTVRRHDLAERFPIRPADPIARVAASGNSIFEGTVDDDALAAMSGGDPEVVSRLRAVGLRSCIAVPIRARGTSVGVLAIMYDGERRYEPDDVRVAEEIAARTAVAYDNALRYEREHRVAESFQKAALPRVLPAIPGTFLSATYEAGRNESLVGGDWYDAIRLPDGRLVLSVGDVAGSGLEAAVTMGSVRQSIRTAALLDPHPAVVLDTADRIVREIDRNRFVTAFVAVFEPINGRMLWASAGHPPPLLRDPAGAVEVLHGSGLPLGLRERGDRTSHVMDVTPGSVLLLYTDGLTELERRPVDGEERLRAALAAAAPARETARSVYAAVASARTHRDDVAVLMMWYEAGLPDVPDPKTWCWRFASDDVAAARRARTTLVARASASGLGPHDVRAIEVVVAELFGNVVRHAPGRMELWLDLTGEAPVVHALDGGPGFEVQARLPSDPLAEHGRGLFVIASLVDEFTSNRRVAGGSHVRAVMRRASPI